MDKEAEEIILEEKMDKLMSNIDTLCYRSGVAMEELVGEVFKGEQVGHIRLSFKLQE